MAQEPAVPQDHPLAAGFLHERAFLLRYLRARGADDAEDLLQDLWFKVVAMTGHPIEDQRAYLVRAAHNLMLDRARSARRRRARDDDYGDYGGSATTPDALVGLIDRERLSRVEAALDALGERTSSIFRRHRVAGEPQRAIADALGLSLSAVEKHLQRAYKAVAALKIVDRDGHDE